MNNLTALELALQSYDQKLNILEKKTGNLSSEIILKLLQARDDVQAALVARGKVPTETLINVIQLDNRLRQKASLICETVPLEDWRASFNPSTEAWWWFLEAPPHPLDRFDWLGNVFTLISLTASTSLVLDISTRFLTGGADFLGAFAVIFQSILTLLTAGTTLTEAGRIAIEQILSKWGIQKYLWQETKIGLSIALLLSLVSLRSCLPQFADYFNDRGLTRYQEGQLAQAMSDFERAISLDPNNLKAHYNLGRLYENLQEVEKARTQYLIAARGDLDAAYNALGRLSLQEGKLPEAASLLQRGLELADWEKDCLEATIQNKKLIKQDEQKKCQEITKNKQKEELEEAIKGNAQVRYPLLKNLGWVRLEQGRLVEAKSHLENAIAIYQVFEPLPPASANCLLAQVLEKKKPPENALQKWSVCLRYADLSKPEEDTWWNLARQRIDKQGTQ